MEQEMERYETALRAKDTGESYRYNVLRYLRALAEASGVASFRDLKRGDLEAWFAQLRERGFTGRCGLSPASLRTVASYTKAFLRWLNEGETPACIRGLVIGKMRARVRSKNELLTPDEIERLIRASNPQKAAILRLLWTTGARPSEVLTLRHEDVAWRTHNGMEYVELAFCDTKTGEPRTVPLAERRALHALRDYLEIANEDG
ncbi:MAG: tyrosine-type recombinase/integrase, partial [Thermoplasmata archaeon]